MADLLAEEEGVAPGVPSGESPPQPRRFRKWALSLGAAASVLLVLGAGVTFWPGQEQAQVTPSPETPLDTKPIWLSVPDARSEQQLAAIGSEDGEMIVGGAPTAEERETAAALKLAARDPDYQQCETEAGDEAIAACDRAIASGKFTGRLLSYLYSDRRFLRMQKGAIDAALADLNKAVDNRRHLFLRLLNRGAVYAAKGDLIRGQEDLVTALALKPDKNSKAKIEEALNAIAAGAAQAARVQPADKDVISVPSWGNEGERAASVPAYSNPADAAPPPAAAMPASPPSLDAAPGSPYGPAVEPMR